MGHRGGFRIYLFVVKLSLFFYFLYFVFLILCYLSVNKDVYNRKSYMSFRLVPKLVTLNDLERRNGR